VDDILIKIGTIICDCELGDLRM